MERVWYKGRQRLAYTPEEARDFLRRLYNKTTPMTKYTLTEFQQEMFTLSVLECYSKADPMRYYYKRNLGFKVMDPQAVTVIGGQDENE